MLRLPRRFIAALLWIAIALLPVRGLASVMMPMMMLGAAPVTASAPAENTASAMPCHAVDQGMSDDAAGSTHTCSLCDLCHSSVVALSQPVIAVPASHESRPRAVLPTAIEPRAPDSLFRPPRPLLA